MYSNLQYLNILEEEKQTSLKYLHLELGEVAEVLPISSQKKKTHLFFPSSWTATSQHFSRSCWLMWSCRVRLPLDILFCMTASCYSGPLIPSCFHMEGALLKKHSRLLSTLLLILTPGKNSCDSWVWEKELGVFGEVPFFFFFESTGLSNLLVCLLSAMQSVALGQRGLMLFSYTYD